MNPLTAKSIDGPVVDGDRRTAWFLAAPQRWSFRSTAERDQLIADAARRVAELTGRRIHLRVTTKPYPVEMWGRSLDADTPDPLPAWPAHLRAEQLTMRRQTLAERQVYWGVEIQTGRLRAKHTRQEVHVLAGIMAGAGINAVPVDPAQMEYLMQRSVTIGCPAPFDVPPEQAKWTENDLASFTDPHWSTKPFDRSVKVIADVNGVQVERHVVVLTLERMTDLDIPETSEPWMQRSDALPFPVEWSVIADVVDNDATKRTMRDTMARASSQLEHFAEHNLPSPMELARQMRKALSVEEAVESGDPLATRTSCWVRAAVSGADEQEALDHAARFVDLYKPQLTFRTGVDQYRRLREFIPGEPLSTEAHRRGMPVTTFAAAMPSVTAMVGDRVGFNIGHTAGTSMQAALYAPHANMEVREGSGLTVVAGKPGAGKSVFIGTMAYQATLTGVPTIVLDPSGPLGRLTSMPTLQGHARTVDLMNADPGELGPYRVIPEPREEDHLAAREDGMTDEQWRVANGRLLNRARISADALRRTLCLDVLKGILPAVTAAKPSTESLLQRATRQVGGAIDRDARMVIDELATFGDEGTDLAGMLNDVAALPQAQLIFPSAGEDRDPFNPDQDWLLQVFTMRGNVLAKEGVPREEWTVQERIGAPLLLLASRLVLSHVYSRPMDQRKVVSLDEAHALMDIGSGRTLFNGLARDSRKWNIRAFMGTQNVADLLAANIGNLMGDCFIGHTTDKDAQVAALKMLGIETGVGYEATLGALKPNHRGSDKRLGYRHFIWADGQGGIEKINLHWPEALRQVLDTTANPALVAPPRDTIEVTA